MNSDRSPEYWRGLAERARTIATNMRHPVARQALERVATIYEAIAASGDRIAKAYAMIVRRKQSDR